MSVVVPVYNCRGSLRRTFRSVFDQTLDREAIEIIAVDDGSTDGSGEELEELAAGHPRFTVLRQEASGGPGRPRNVGLEHATGEYVLFLDADDYLGAEALERLCAMADAQGTDVVIPKYVGVGGRRVHPELFRETVEFTTIYDEVPNLYGSITVLKLYRRALLEEHRIRFPEGVLSGEDQIFAVTAYFKAKGVSIVADYDCYYWVLRDDGSSALQLGGAPAADYFPQIERLMGVVAEHTEPGPGRDRFMRRHFAYEVFSRFDPRYQDFTEEERGTTQEAARKLVEAWYTPDIAEVQTPYQRLLAYCLRHRRDDLLDEAARVHAAGLPPIVVEGSRAYATYPGFRAGVPDDCFEVIQPLKWRRLLTSVEWQDSRLLVRGDVQVERVPKEEQAVELVLKLRDTAPSEEERPSGAPTEQRVPFPAAIGPERVAEIDFAELPPLPPGRWDVEVEVTMQGIVQRGRLTGTEVPGPRVAPVESGRPYVTPYLTKGPETLALHVGGLAGGPPPEVSGRVTTAPQGLYVEVRLTAAPPIAEPPAEVRAVLRHRGTEEVHRTELSVRRLPGALEVAGELDLSGRRPGTWDVSYEIAVGGGTVELRAPAPADLPAEDKGIRPYQTVKGNLSIDIGKPGLLARFRGLLTRSR